MRLACLALFLITAQTACSGADHGFLADDAALVLERDAGDAAIPISDDAGGVVSHDGGGPSSCVVTCDCAQGLACLRGQCRSGGVGPVWCCEKPGCPPGLFCLNGDDRPDQCGESADAGT